MNKVKSIKFNLDNPEELELFQYVNSKDNFSGFIKSLIERDKQKSTIPVYRSNADGVIKIQF